jgi:hypothetical protein
VLYATQRQQSIGRIEVCVDSFLHLAWESLAAAPVSILQRRNYRLAQRFAGGAHAREIKVMEASV